LIILILIILGIYKYWTEIEKFETEDLAYDSLKSDWKYINNSITNEGDKSVFKCNVNKLCKAELKLVYTNSNETVSLFTNNIEHDHSVCDETDWGIPKATQQKMEELYKSGVCKPKLILYALSYAKFTEPTKEQVNNWVPY
jgi:hypothetical protein